MSTKGLIKRILILVVAVGLAAVLGTTAGRRLAKEREEEHGSHQPGAQLQAGKALPAHTFHDLDGAAVDLRPLVQGRKTVLFFFSTECEPCLNYIDEWDEWLRTGDVDYHFFAVSPDDESKLRGFADMYEPAFRILCDREGRFATEYEMPTLPVIVGVDADGVISFVEIGYRTDKHIEIDYWLRDG